MVIETPDDARAALAECVERQREIREARAELLSAVPATDEEAAMVARSLATADEIAAMLADTERRLTAWLEARSQAERDRAATQHRDTKARAFEIEAVVRRRLAELDAPTQPCRPAPRHPARTPRRAPRRATPAMARATSPPPEPPAEPPSSGTKVSSSEAARGVS